MTCDEQPLPKARDLQTTGLVALPVMVGVWCVQHGGQDAVRWDLVLLQLPQCK